MLEYLNVAKVNPFFLRLQKEKNSHQIHPITSRNVLPIPTPHKDHKEPIEKGENDKFM